MSTLEKTKRKIIEIDEDLCNGCGDCVPGCAEGALQIIDGKARLISDLFCDGLGACLGSCPMDAIRIIEREAEPYDERAVMKEMLPKGEATIVAHLEHLLDHGATDLYREGVDYLKERGVPVPAHRGEKQKSDEKSGCAGSCPGSAPIDLKPPKDSEGRTSHHGIPGPSPSRLGNWPVQIALVPPRAPYLDGADLLIAADCTAFATGAFHEELAKGRVVLIGCPKLDEAAAHAMKLTQIIKENDVRSVTVAHMTVPCCFGMSTLVRSALTQSGKDLPLNTVVVGLDGELDRPEPRGKTQSGLKVK